MLRNIVYESHNKKINNATIFLAILLQFSRQVKVLLALCLWEKQTPRREKAKKQKQKSHVDGSLHSLFTHNN